ncbi:MAG: serine/threonine-protein kinase [Thermoanaerobaculia bacterium]|nr:serine/threonine-protein kinase [Thermoanaerobaculia bacterium]
MAPQDPTGAAALAAGARLGPYEITAKLGEGGMGEVYRATDTKLKRDVAIKVLPAAFTEDRERLARFEREAQLLAQLHHPNIASIFGLEESAGTRALVMELVEGPTLAERLASGALPLPECLSVARQIAEALEEAHEKGIVHRDLKPANVKVTDEGKVKVLDFGLAKALDASVAPSSTAGPAGAPSLMNSPTLTAARGTELGMILGTAAYMAPEQAKGKAVDRRGDIWAFGVVLFELLTGRRLFAGETASEVLAAVIREEIDWTSLPQETPPGLRRLLERCLERDPRLRLRDIGEARIALEKGVDLEPVAAPVDGAPVPRRVRREAAAWSLAATFALAALVAAGAWLARGSERGSQDPPRVIRAVLPLPAGVSIELDGERAGMPALSHDGRRVAFGAREGTGPMRIWVQELATGAARPLPGTEEGYRPFWSPDDRRIGYFTWSHMATTPADGGAVAQLARARDARGGTWNRDGTILFAPHQYGPLFTISERGGDPQPATAFGDGARSGTHRFPQFLPDGQHFLYLERLSTFGPGQRAGLMLGRLGSLAPVARLLDGATNAVFAEGQILHTRDGALVARAFDPGARTVADEAHTLVGDLLVNRRFSYGVFSAADRGVLAFLTGHQSDRSQLVWRDRSGKRLGELGTPGVLSGVGGLALSRDGRWAAVSRIEEGTSEADIWIYDLASGNETRLARPGRDDYAPIFDADGGALYFGSEGEGSQGSLVRRDLTSGAESELFSLPNRYILPMSLSRDGAWLVYDLGDESSIGVYDVRLRPLTGTGEERTLVGSTADDAFGQISPDGRWLAWASDESGRYEVYVAPFPGPGARVQVSRAGGVQPRWHPAGGELFFKTPDNTLVAVPTESGSGTFAVGAPVPLFRIVEFLGWTYDVAADGERFLVREPLAEGDASPVTLLTDWTALIEREER